jgi:4-alpha-glucanotransferase
MQTILQDRRAGVLLHITSLPSGRLGEDAFRFVDFLKKVRASVWQTLPLNIPHADGSPYQCLSAHAGNPALICPHELVKMGLLETHQTQFESAIFLKMAFNQFKASHDESLHIAFHNFLNQNPWLEHFALFMSLREHFAHQSWSEWPQGFKWREVSVLEQAKNDFSEQIDYHKFVQFIFFKQLDNIKSYCNNQGIFLFGDIPIFVSYDSADVWSSPEQFNLDESLNMRVVAGVPPDYFSAVGQRWGNPHYNWEAMQQQGFDWWLARIGTQARLFDMIRIDHFRGLEAAWQIPAQEETAIQGSWVKAPGKALLETIIQHYPQLTLIAEDLGVITPEVDALRVQFNLPGMKILQFAFDGTLENPYLPEKISENSVVYTGTHDNDTTLGWFQSLDEEAKAHVYQYFEANLHLSASSLKMPQDLVGLALSTKSKLCMIPMQDILGLDGKHRMNVPGTTTDNWCWQFSWDQLNETLTTNFADAIALTGRAN